MLNIREYGYGLVVEVNGVRQEISPVEYDEFMVCSTELREEFDGCTTRINELEVKVENLESEVGDLQQEIKTLLATWTPPVSVFPDLSVK